MNECRRVDGITGSTVMKKLSVGTLCVLQFLVDRPVRTGKLFSTLAAVLNMSSVLAALITFLFSLQPQNYPCSIPSSHAHAVYI